MSIESAYDLDRFNEACDEFVNGKYILADLKLSSILKSIAYSEKIKNLITKCLEGVDVNALYEKVLNPENQVVMPNDAKSVVALVFSILYNIDNGNINFFDFLSMYFKSQNELTAKDFEEFSNIVISPFKKAINVLYANEHLLSDSREYQSNVYNKVKRVAELELKNLTSYRLKPIAEEELQILLEALITASDNNDKQYTFALMISFDYFTQINKKCRPIFAELQNCFRN